MIAKTMIVIAKEWRDEVNGNSYYSAQINLNFGLTAINKGTEKFLKIPMTYGYDDQFIFDTKKLIESLNIKNKIVRDTFIKIKDCKKQEVEKWGKL